jgi:hypothetical protein
MTDRNHIASGSPRAWLNELSHQLRQLHIRVDVAHGCIELADEIGLDYMLEHLAIEHRATQNAYLELKKALRAARERKAANDAKAPQDERGAAA